MRRILSLAIMLPLLLLAPATATAATSAQSSETAQQSTARLAVAAQCPDTLSRGDYGEMVVALQSTLNNYPYEVTGPDLVPDGIYGPKTEAAVINFQSWYGLQVDGITGPETWGQLGSCW
ncbi:Putative peptidoglycan binding domain-containing protein [Actinopolyspora lacussalsi subsp. righensis]|uniref:Putative peptidoglycan binding domain-containing protein n=1 Tax=Actinopolyspora righensis TaxID=995060 RepID=A0A1I6YTV2_9ACTN|nr:peptidoglycan-binding domain-containing protein [Actinopolyspora righensis]SFT53698.1 Putative peptidoglycan binding domain-containing protein [Actinopolyspora righensis]